eukprot:TRINITY_DN6492_c0_g1_i1.p1 TRINITY_DN6492_c0_g1~~TRINITY_DN6492_c0_g1_i1.p1  ORF type:complete len:61 (-),score=5.90 TRINITY_DN6492_c0_g1_i1:240-422(-)
MSTKPQFSNDIMDPGILSSPGRGERVSIKNADDIRRSVKIEILQSDDDASVRKRVFPTWQ